MAAGIIQGTVTTTTGETIELSWLVDDTGSPTKWWNSSLPINSAGNAVAFGTGAMGATVLRMTLATDDPAVAILGASGDAASATTTIKAALRQIATATGSTAITRAGGAADSGTVRVTVDTGQLAASVTADQTSSVAGQVVRIPPQEVHLGEVGGKSALKIITMTADTGVLASGDLIADTQQFDAFFRKTDGTGVINTISITEKDAQGAAYYIGIHRTSTSLGTENSAPNISDANMVAGFQHIIAVATTDFVTVSGTKVATLKNLGLPVMAVSGTDDLYFSILNSTGTPTYASGEIQLGIGVLLD
jgi:hypothetical protein